jgi:hypothetical protein
MSIPFPLFFLLSVVPLVIRSFQDVAKAMRMKMAWKLVTETSLWSTFFKQEYTQNIHPWYAAGLLETLD